jgi:archaeosine-15-forming tRNA-guanine transglycosylase
VSVRGLDLEGNGLASGLELASSGITQAKPHPPRQTHAAQRRRLLKGALLRAGDQDHHLDIFSLSPCVGGLLLCHSTIEAGIPCTIEVSLEGVSDLLFHRWNPEAVDEKAKAAKNSKAKRTDDIESYVYRNDAGELCIPGEYLRQAIIHAAKFRQDPRSPRKSAMDLYKAGVLSLTPLASLGITKWDYEDKRRVVIQRSAINRIRPAIKTGWRATFELMVNLPEYITPNDLRDVITNAGRLVGLGDFRPTYGRFAISQFDVI